MAYVPSFGGLTGDDEEEQKRLQGSEAGNAPVYAGGAAPPGSAPSYTQSNYASGKKILEKAQNDPVNFAIGDEYNRELDKAGADLEKSKANWSKQYEEALQPYRFSGEDVSKAVAGQDAGRLQSFLGTDYSGGGAATQVKPFAAPSAPFNEAEAAQLGTGAGLQGEIANAQRKAGNYGYTRGQAALDSVIYGGSQDVRNQVADIARKSTEYGNKKAAYAKEAEDKAAGLTGELKKIQDAIRADLQAQADAITAGARAATPGRIPQMYRPTDYYSKDDKTYFKNLISELSGGIDERRRGEFEKQANAYLYGNGPAPAQAGKFFSRSAPDVAYNDAEAGRFNSIMGLLGRGQSAQAGAGEVSLDRKGLSDELANQAKALDRLQGKVDTAKESKAQKSEAAKQKSASEKRAQESAAKINSKQEKLKDAASQWYGVPKDQLEIQRDGSYKPKNLKGRR